MGGLTGCGVTSTPAPHTTVAPTVSAAAPQTLGDGHWLVGRDIPEGIYHTTTAVINCYTERADSSGGVIDNNFISYAPAGTQLFLRNDMSITIKNCGPWKQTSTKTAYEPALGDTEEKGMSESEINTCHKQFEKLTKKASLEDATFNDDNILQAQLLPCAGDYTVLDNGKYYLLPESLRH